MANPTRTVGCEVTQGATRLRVVRIVSLSLVGLAASSGCARPLLGPVTTQPASADKDRPDGWLWAECLHQTVRGGAVDYARLAKDPAPLDRFLMRLARPPEPNDTGASRTSRLINAYNALAMRAGLEQFRAAGGDPARARAPDERRYGFRFHGQEVTLVDLRARLLAGPTPDARILFALCAADAGVPLSDQPFEASVLDRQLKAAAAAAMGNPSLVLIDHENMALRVADVIGRHRSMLIRWYQRRTGAGSAALLSALLDLADDRGRDRLNAAVGYRIAPRPRSRRLNVYVPAAVE